MLVSRPARGGSYSPGNEHLGTRDRVVCELLRHHQGGQRYVVRQWSDDVVFFVHTYDLTAAEEARLQARSIGVIRGEVARPVVEADRMIGVELKDGRVIPRTAVFIRPGSHPHHDGLLSGLGCEVDEAG